MYEELLLFVVRRLLFVFLKFVCKLSIQVYISFFHSLYIYISTINFVIFSSLLDRTNSVLVLFFIYYDFRFHCDSHITLLKNVTII